MTTSTVAEIDFQQFCEPESGSLDKPWVAGGIRFATDGRILVCEPTDDPDTDLSVYPKRKPPTATGKLYGQAIAANCDQLLPVDVPDCPECGQSGLVEYWICSECEGNGEQECDLGHMHDCGKCGGHGCSKRRIGSTSTKYPCYRDEKHCSIVVGNQKFQRHYVQKIRSLPGVPMVSVETDMMFVRFSGSAIVVVLMALMADI